MALLFAALWAAGCGPANGNRQRVVDDGDGGTTGGPCSEGTTQCTGLSFQTCTGGSWANTMACPASCDATLGCVACPPNGMFCQGDNVVGCDANGNPTKTITTCMSACSGGACTDPCSMAASELSYLGCNYFPTVTSNSQLIEESHFAIAVANPNTDTVNIQVTRAGKSIVMQSLAPGALATINLPWVDSLKGTAEGTLGSIIVKGGGYLLSSSEPVSVYQFNPIEFQVAGCVDPNGGGPCYTYTNDASLLLPSSTLTAHYIAIARESFMLSQSAGGQTQYSSLPGFISIVGVENATATVQVKLTADTLVGTGGSPAAYKAGSTATFTLAQGDVVQLLSAAPATCNPSSTDSDGAGTTYGYCDVPSTDLTGTEITADHKLAVFSGHDCTFIPYNRWACDHLEQQMLPLESWGTDYLGSHTVRTPSTIPDVWRVVSGADGNTITFDPASVHAPITLNRGQWAEFTSTADFEATSNVQGGAFQLVQYMTGQNYNGFNEGGDNPGDPAMSLAVPLAQYRNSYTFLTPASYTLNYVNVTAPVGTTVTLDNAAIPANSFTPFGAGKYATARVKLNAGTHNISSAVNPFGIAVYGLAAYTSYMYPGGLNVTQININ